MEIPATGMQKNHIFMIAVYSMSHLLVDFSCAFLMFSYYRAANTFIVALLCYNFCAFAAPMPLGVIADRLNRNHLFAAIGCSVILAVYIAFMLSAIHPSQLVLVDYTIHIASRITREPLAISVIIGLANGAFHIGSGIDVLNISTTKSLPLGLFVCTGAYGVYFGTRLGTAGSACEAPISACLLLAAITIVAWRHNQKTGYVENAHFDIRAVQPAEAAHAPAWNTMLATIAATCFFIVVGLRSYTGLILSFNWQGQGFWGLALVTAVVCGKALGGLLADSFGVEKTARWSLGLASFLFLLPQYPVLGVLSVLLFNMSMPITLFAMARLLPGAKGFSFGLLTFAIFIGLIPFVFGQDNSYFYFGLRPLLGFVSMAILSCGLHIDKTLARQA
ncbi:MAG: hypothetical protein FWH40_01160 [Coriobacteriia bacterium]|nr:hypothetical protein [Coriobacteriia bacterium]